jgi:hypothetical protein
VTSGRDSRDFPVARGGTEKPSGQVSGVPAEERTGYLSNHVYNATFWDSSKLHFPDITRPARDGGRFVTPVSRFLAGARTGYLSTASLQRYLPGFLEVKFPRFTRAALDGSRFVRVTNWPRLPATHFCQKSSRSQNHRAVGRPHVKFPRFHECGTGWR